MFAPRESRDTNRRRQPVGAHLCETVVLVLVGDDGRERPGTDRVTGGERLAAGEELAAGVINGRARTLRHGLQRLDDDEAVNERLRAEHARLACARVVTGAAREVEDGGDTACCGEVAAAADVSAYPHARRGCAAPRPPPP